MVDEYEECEVDVIIQYGDILTNVSLIVHGSQYGNVR